MDLVITTFVFPRGVSLVSAHCSAFSLFVDTHLYLLTCVCGMFHALNSRRWSSHFKTQADMECETRIDCWNHRCISVYCLRVRFLLDHLRPALLFYWYYYSWWWWTNIHNDAYLFDSSWLLRYSILFCFHLSCLEPQVRHWCDPLSLCQKYSTWAQHWHNHPQNTRSRKVWHCRVSHLSCWERRLLYGLVLHTPYGSTDSPSHSRLRHIQCHLLYRHRTAIKCTGDCVAVESIAFPFEKLKVSNAGHGCLTHCWSTT